MLRRVPAFSVRKVDSISLEGAEEGLDEGLVVPPATDGTGVNGLAHLDQAGRPHDSAGRVEREAARFPLEPEELDHATSLCLEVEDEPLVGDVEPFRRAGP